MKTLQIVGILVAVIAFGAIKASESQFQIRKLISDIQEEKRHQDKIQNEWTQLILEEATLTNEPMVYDIAEKNLGLMIPTATNIVYDQARYKSVSFNVSQ